MNREIIIPFIMRGIYVANGVSVDALDISEVERYKKLFKQFEVEQLAYLLETLVKIKESRIAISGEMARKIMV